MKILVLNGSYRKNGNTAHVTRLIAQHMQQAAAGQNLPLEVETLFISDLQLEACRGCRSCFDRGEEKCPVKDDMPALREKIRQADGVLFASPVYVDDVNGISKNFIDRMAYACHRPEFAGKTACLVATVGSSPTAHALGTLRRAFSTWGFTIAAEGGFKTGALMQFEDMQAVYSQKAQKTAERFVGAIARCACERPSFLSLLTFKIQQLFWQNHPGDSFDYQYWQSRGWTDARADFYIPHKANRVKVLLARWTGAVIARFVS